MNKKRIIEKIIKDLEEKLAGQELILKKIDRDRRDAPSFMQSASDTTRAEKQQEGDDYQLKIQDTKDSIDYFKNTNLDGNFLKVVDDEDRIINYLMVEKGGGIILKEDFELIGEEGRLIAISKETPLYNCLKNQKVGDTCILIIGEVERELKILEIF
ncbi:hypothetical protein KKH36_02310 [Patescibacteria group bacterium]|nr:hypothetical protein [Patescibacteria group bacterium]